MITFTYFTKWISVFILMPMKII